MAKSGTFHVSVRDGKVWAYLRRCSGDQSAPLHEVLTWALEQMNLGNWHVSVDEEGFATSLTVGLAAAADAEDATPDEVAEAARRRLTVLNIVGLFARGREEGVSPREAQISEEVRMTATEAGYRNTEFHYAFELVEILKRIRDSTFVFAAPPIKGSAGGDVVALLKEATRAYLFGLRRSAVSVCRALVEASLRQRVDATDLLNERWQSKRGELECLINIAARKGILTSELARRAHGIRTAGNRALHGDPPTDEDAWSILVDTRGVVEIICSPAV